MCTRSKEFLFPYPILSTGAAQWPSRSSVPSSSSQICSVKSPPSSSLHPSCRYNKMYCFLLMSVGASVVPLPSRQSRIMVGRWVVVSAARAGNTSILVCTGVQGRSASNATCPKVRTWYRPARLPNRATWPRPAWPSPSLISHEGRPCNAVMQRGQPSHVRWRSFVNLSRRLVPRPFSSLLVPPPFCAVRNPPQFVPRSFVGPSASDLCFRC